jgi:hypothetical protein
MKIFSFEPEHHRAAFKEQGWVHVKGGATPEFCAQVRDFVARRAEVGGIQRRGLQNEKDQFLLELPPEFDLTSELFDHLSVLCDLERSGMTLSERHVNAYAPDANPRPRPHKDRYASAVSVGISIDIPPGSHLVMYPSQDLGVNPLLRSGVADTLLPREQPESTLEDAQELVIHDAPGDVQAFLGSRIWHLRRNAGGTVIAYFKVNDFWCDPLGEDPRTLQVREQTVSMLDDRNRFLDAMPRLARRYESVTHEYARSGEADWLNVHVNGQPARRVSEMEFQLLRSLDGLTSVKEALSGSKASDVEEVEAAIRRLARLGAIDLYDER